MDVISSSTVSETTVTFRLPKEDLRRLDEAADRLRIGRSALIRLALAGQPGIAPLARHADELAS